MKGSMEGKLGSLGPLTRNRTCLDYPTGCHSEFPIVERSGNHWQRVIPPTFSFLVLEMFTWIFEGIWVLPNSLHSSHCLNLHWAIHPFLMLWFFFFGIYCPQPLRFSVFLMY